MEIYLPPSWQDQEDSLGQNMLIFTCQLLLQWIKAALYLLKNYELKGIMLFLLALRFLSFLQRFNSCTQWGDDSIPFQDDLLGVLKATFIIAQNCGELLVFIVELYATRNEGTNIRRVRDFFSDVRWIALRNGVSRLCRWLKVHLGMSESISDLHAMRYAVLPRYFVSRAGIRLLITP